MTIGVVGFGRSGSTWVGDVVGRLAGGLMLNEPLNPCMGFGPHALRYGERPSAATSARLRAMLTGQVRDPWLLRSEFAPLARADHRAVAGAWRERPIVGLKETLHGCFSVGWLADELDDVVFVYRSPASVLASVAARPAFWAWGWPAHYEIVMDASVRSKAADGSSLADLRQFDVPGASRLQRMAVVLAACMTAALADAVSSGCIIADYDDLAARDEPWVVLSTELGLVWDSARAAVRERSRTTYGPPARLDGDDLATIETICGAVDRLATSIVRSPRPRWPRRSPVASPHPC